MKTSKIIAVALAATLLTAGFTSCGDDYDDTVLKGQISDLDQRVTTLEEKVKTDIAAIQASINTINGYDFVKSVKKVTDGYEITFSKGTVAVIKNGTDGKDGINGTDGKDGINGTDGKDGVDGTNGKDGADGKDGVDGTNGKDGINGTNGKDGVSPVLTAKQDEVDKQFYWQVNGDWLKDTAGNKIPASRAPKITADTFEDDGNNNKYWKIDGEWLRDEQGAMVRVTADATPVKFDAEVNEEAGTIDFDFAGKKYTVNIAKSELTITETGVAGFMIVDNANEYTVDIPAGWEDAIVRADIASNDENKTAITRNGSFAAFTVAKESNIAKVTVNPASFSDGDLAELTVTMTKDGEKRAGSIFVTMKVMGSKDFDATTAGSIAETLNSTTNPVFYNAITVSGTSVMNNDDWAAINKYPYANTLTISASGVTTVPDNALKGNTRLTAFTGNASLVEIGANAFEGCTALTTLNNVNNVTTLGESAFKDCTELTGAITMTALTGAIPASTFDGCIKLTHAPIVAAVTEIGNYAFRGCKALTVANLGTATSVETLGESAFEGCEKLDDLSSALNNAGLTAYPKNAFKDCKALTTIGSANVVSIGESAFENCVALSALTVAGSGITSLGAKAFKGCAALGTIPDMATSLKVIPEEAFADCVDLDNTSVANVTTIEASAFKGCTFSGASVAFPNVVTIKANAFENCTFSNAATFAAATTIGDAAFKGVTFSNTIEFTLAETIGNNAFELCTFGGNVTFDAATSIGNKAFGGADFGSNTLDFKAVITQLGANAFTDATTGSATVKVKAGSEGEKYNKKWANVTWGTVTEVPNP